MDDAIQVGPFGGCGGRDPFIAGPAVLKNIKITLDPNSAAIENIEINVQRGATITLGSGEYLTGMTAYVGQFGGSIVVRSLSFASNLGHTFGPYGPQEGTSNSVPLTEAKIAGLFGCKGALVNAIGVWVVKN